MNQDEPEKPEAPAQPPAIVPPPEPPVEFPPVVEPPASLAVPSVTAAPVTKLASPDAVRVRVPSGPQYAPPRRNGSIRVVAIVAFFVLVAYLFFRPHSSGSEQLATRVTVAIQNNNMAPVEKEFNALNRPELENHARVGRLSDQVVALGKLESVKEDTPKDAPAGHHHFVVKFEKATWAEDMTIDGDGKIGTFNIHPPSVAQP
jgi:hypothetical protein